MSQIMQMLNDRFSPIDNFKILTFQNGNINLKEIVEAATFDDQIPVNNSLRTFNFFQKRRGSANLDNKQSFSDGN